jgi:hypothetical protein
VRLDSIQFSTAFQSPQSLGPKWVTNPSPCRVYSSVFVDLFCSNSSKGVYPTLSKQFRGKSEDADSVFLGADFWKPGVKIAGKVIRTFESENGPCYVVDLINPAKVDGELMERVSIGNLTGFRMALQAAGLDRLQPNDDLHLECTGLKSTTKGSPRPNFEVRVTRP